MNPQVTEPIPANPETNQVQPETNPVQPVPPSPKSKLPLILGIIVLLGIVGVLGVLGIKYLSGSKTPANVQSEISPVPTQISTPTSNPTINWKTYYNSTYGYSILYPPILKILKDSESNDHLTLVDIDYSGDGAARFLVGILITKSKNIDEFESIYSLSDGKTIAKENFSLRGASALGGKLTKVANRVINGNRAVDYIYIMPPNQESGTLINNNDLTVDFYFNGSGDLNKFKSEYSDQILSTFHFLALTEEKLSCGGFSPFPTKTCPSGYKCKPSEALDAPGTCVKE